MIKKSLFKIKGMQRDLSEANYSPEYSYENRNIRITATDDNTLLSLTNEKGTKYTEVKGIGKHIKGIPIGHSLMNDEYVLFTSGDPELKEIKDIDNVDKIIQDIYGKEYDIDIESDIEDRIYKIWLDNKEVNGETVYRGDLNFSVYNPIETLAFYENEDIKKVYWTDGLNIPRLVNIADKLNYNDNSFDFIHKLKLKESVSITKSTLSNGLFAPGVIQYAFTYYNQYKQESNIFYISPLYYISYLDRGANAEDKVSNSFTINLDNLDNSFDYVRIYSIHRSSIDSTPFVKRIVDIPINKSTTLYNESEYRIPINKQDVYIETVDGNILTLLDMKPIKVEGNKEIFLLSPVLHKYIRFYSPEKDNGYTYIEITDNFFADIEVVNGNQIIVKGDLNIHSAERKSAFFIDNGILGSSVDPTELLYKGGEEIISGTMAQKDNTLFLGDIKLKRSLINKEIRDYFKFKIPEFKLGKIRKSPSFKGFYPYENTLKYNARELKSFKYLETYRLGVQFQHYSGRWSEPIFINDIRNEVPINSPIGYIENNIELPVAQFNIEDKTIITKLLSEGYTKIRPVIVYPSLNDRECICQGLLCPTMFNLVDRFNNRPFAQSSWFIRPYVRNTDLLVTNKSTIGDNVEYRHYYPLPNAYGLNAEIQSVRSNSLGLEEVTTSSADLEKSSDLFFVDQSILTFHSPDIEFDDNIKNLDTSNLKLRIVGYIPLTSFYGDIDIQTDTPPNQFKGTSVTALGFKKFNISYSSESLVKTTLNSGTFWYDDVSDINEGLTNTNKVLFGFVVYPFHRNGSLNNQDRADDNGYKSALLKQKRMSNIKVSFASQYFNKDKIWNAYKADDDNNTGITKAELFDSNEMIITKLDNNSINKSEDLVYYGNVETDLISNTERPYPIVISKFPSSEPNFGSQYELLENYRNEDKKVTDTTYGVDPVSMKYKSTAHFVLALNNTKSNNVKILPTFNSEEVITDYSNLFKNFKSLSWNSEIAGITQDYIDIDKVPYNWLWLGELYDDTVKNRFGGQTEEAFENNEWLPCGEPISLLDGINIKDSLTLTWEEGDTYYQRYDHLKTYPFTKEEQNSIVEIVSFMCETRVNLDGRYDKNRGLLSNLTITPEVFNLMNPVYNQKDNIFVYRAVNPIRFSLDNFRNSVTWTKTKMAGELIDTWTNITMASTLDLDGDKGIVRAIRKINNSLIAFQDSGISQILYNENTQLTTAEGVPIEIGNSGKVQGKRYISDSIGCVNKWSICESPLGLYFIDDISKNIFLFNGKLDNLSDRLGFHSWLVNNSKDVDVWNPYEFNNFVVYYNKINKDVYIVLKDDCLTFSESLNQFSSFYNYGDTPYISNITDRSIMVHKAANEKYYKIWLQNEGYYNRFFYEYKPFSTTIIANENPLSDKIFNNIEFRADSWDEESNLLDSTFDLLTTWNEYQYGELELDDIYCNPSSLKKKFRIWRANIPRDKTNKMDRMRNPWLYLKLSKETHNTDKTTLHDIVVQYYE